MSGESMRALEMRLRAESVQRVADVAGKAPEVPRLVCRTPLRQGGYALHALPAPPATCPRPRPRT